LAWALKLQIDPITPCITSIPCFIKSLLDIIFKLGIAAATFFLIWAGFLFLQAQGEPAKLTTAKKALLWAVIGTAVIFGSWMLSTVIKVTIWQRIGSNVPLDSFDICACATTPSPTNSTCASLGKQCLSFDKCSIPTITTPTPADCTGGTSCCDPSILYTIPPIPSHETQVESASEACTGGGGDTLDEVVENTFRQYWSYFSWVSKTPLGTADVDLGNVSSNGAQDCLYEKGVYMTKIQANQVSNEQGWFYVIGTDGKNQWKSVGIGTNKQILVPLQDYQQVLSNGAQGIIDFHTHPQDGLKNNKGQSIPSSGDILAAAANNSIFGASVLFRVSDSAVDLSRPDAPYTVWAYNATNGTPFVSLTKTGIGDGWNTFINSLLAMANNQKDPEAIRAINFFDHMAGGSVTATNTDTWLNAAWTLLDDTASGSYGPTIEKIAQEYGQKIGNTPLFAWWDTYRNCTNDEDITNKMLEIYRNNGVTVTEEQHPYLSCVTPAP